MTFRRFGVALVVLGFALAGGAAVAVYRPRPPPPDTEQDEIYSAVLAKPWVNETKDATLVDTPDAFTTFKEEELRRARTDPTRASTWPGPIERLVEAVRPANVLGYSHAYPAAVGTRLPRGTNPAGNFLLSRIAFNRGRDRAVVKGQFSWTSPYPFSEGYIFYLARDASGHWSLVEDRMLWIT
ncbi:MAG: hypothetical protein QM765_35735 [Myxococcales bacterium]